MKKEINRLLTEEVPKLIEFDLVASVEVKGWFYMLSLTEKIPKLTQFDLVTSLNVKGQFYMLYSCKII